MAEPTEGRVQPSDGMDPEFLRLATEGRAVHREALDTLAATDKCDHGDSPEPMCRWCRPLTAPARGQGRGDQVIVGIDSGACRLAICVLDPNDPRPRFAWYETLPGTDAEELEDLQWWLANERESWWKPDVWLEKVVKPHGAAQRSFDGMSRHSMTIGMVMATVGGTLLTPATWKASILGHGHADKDDTEYWVRRCAPAVAEAIEAQAPRNKARRADLFDAYCIALHGDLARRHPDRLDEPKRVPRRRSRAGA